MPLRTLECMHGGREQERTGIRAAQGGYPERGSVAGAIAECCRRRLAVRGVSYPSPSGLPAPRGGGAGLALRPAVRTCLSLVDQERPRPLRITHPARGGRGAYGRRD